MRQRHPKKEIEEALQEAEAAGMRVEDQHGHWGVIWCPGEEGDRCPRPFWVWSTPRNVQNHAKQIRRYVARWTHKST